MKTYKTSKRMTFRNLVVDNIDNDILLSYLYFLNSTERKFSNEIIPNDIFKEKNFSDIVRYIMNTPKLLNFLVDNRYIEEIVEFKPVTITIETLEEFKSLYSLANCEPTLEVENIIKKYNKEDVIPETFNLYRIWSELEQIREEIL